MEQEFVVKLLETRQVTHDVKQFRFEKPEGYVFKPGQATEIAINKPGWEKERRPFTFTALNEDPFLQFTIKRYADHNGVTDQLHQLQPGDSILLHDVWGAIEYKGPGCFIAGGAGITPFLAIFRQLHKSGTAVGNVLFFSNKTSRDVIEAEELREILGEGAHFILSKEEKKGYEHGRIDAEYLKARIKNFKRPFYVCGPDQMVKDINQLLTELGASAEALVFEK